MSDSNRTLIPFTNEHFIAFCEAMLGQPYWYGCGIYKCTENLRSRKAKQYPQHYSSSRTARYRKDIAAKKIAADCVGACKGYAWTGSGIGVFESIGTDKPFSSKYCSNGCPDVSANGMFSYAKSQGMAWGKIDTLPEIVGLALAKPGHIGYYAGNGYAIEWRGFDYGCVKTKVSGRGWTHWYKLPFIDYGDGADCAGGADCVGGAGSTGGAGSPYSQRDLYYKKGKPMLRGDDVRQLQTDLNTLSFSCGTADGVFGPKTDLAVRAFQKAWKLKVDGIVGGKTRATLGAALKSLGGK